MGELRDFLIKEIPEFDWIQDKDLKEKTIQCFEMVIETRGWTTDELKNIPFTLLIDEPSANLLNHTRSVTTMAKKVGETFNGFYTMQLNMDYLVAGALLHDVGKFVEYEKDGDNVKVSLEGKLLRHPFYGALVAFKVGIPNEIINIIALHSKEGEKNKRTPEGIIIHHCDFMNFEPFRV
ncbi:HD domain-containing protein [Candidatus Dependentiae bacterium]|nr:HD domain-containing protein [Candidatus Dependentiae bacterium]